MSVSLTIAGQSYQYPTTADDNWGENATNWAIAVSTELLQRTGGNFSLTADVNFGASFGLTSVYFKSRSSNIANAGALRLARADEVVWRNQANNGNLALGVNSSDELTFNGQVIPGQTGTVGPTDGGTGITSYTTGDTLYASATNVLSKLSIGSTNYVLKSDGSIPGWGLIADASIDAAAAIAFSKLAPLSSGNLLVGSAGNVATSVAVTGDVVISNTGVTSISSGVIVDADVNASAGIALSKLAALTASKLLESSAGGVITPSTGSGYVKGTSGTPSYVSQIPLSTDVTGILPKANGGSGQDNSSITFPASGTLTTNAGTQTLSNKTFSDALTIAEISTPSTPSSGFGKIYFKSDGFAYQLNDDGSESKIGAGAGGINYITNNDASSNTTGWLTYSNTAQSTPVSGAGGTATGVTFTRSTTTPLRGVASFILSKDAVNRQGKGVAYDFTIADADLAQPLTIAFDYRPTSGFVAGTGASSLSDVVVYICDTSSGEIIQAAPFVLAGGSGANQKFSAVFQTNSNSNSYRLIFHIASTNATAWDLKIDDVLVGPQVQLYGSPISDWQTYTPTITGAGTVSLLENRWRRVGSNMEIRIQFTAGTVTGSTLTFGLPSGYSARFMSGASTVLLPGNAATTYTGGNIAGLFPIVDSGTPTVFGVANNNTADGFSYKAANSILINASSMSVNASIPILGWESNVAMSQDASTRVVAAQYRNAASTSLTGGASQVIPFTTVISDTHNASSGSGTSWVYTCPVSGYYRVSIMMQTQTVAWSATDGFVAQLLQNGGSVRALGNMLFAANVSTVGAISGSQTVLCRAGDTLAVELNASKNASLVNSSAYNILSIERLSGPATIAATETVSAGCGQAASGSVTVGNAVLFNGELWDTHGSYNPSTGIFTAPIAGFYQITGTVASNLAQADFRANVNGADVTRVGWGNNTGLATIAGMVKCNAGDLVKITCSNTITVGDGTLYIMRAPGTL